MRSRQRVAYAGVLGAAGLVGLLGAHILDYTLLFRDPLARAGLLRQTGHAYLAHAVEFAIVSALLAVIGSFALGFWRGRGPAIERPSTLRVAYTLALIQSGGFVALEAGERLAAHALGQRALTITALGVALQIVVAAAAASVLCVIERAGEIAGSTVEANSGFARAIVAPPFPVEPAIKRLDVASQASPRAPPLALVS